MRSETPVSSGSLITTRSNSDFDSFDGNRRINDFNFSRGLQRDFDRARDFNRTSIDSRTKN